MPENFIIKAGRTAFTHVKKYGLQPSDIFVIPAAAGGPKWITLYGLDQYLVSEWFSKLDHQLHLIGASAGAWRMLCYCLPDSGAALDRYLKYYIEQRYTTWPGPDEVSSELSHIIHQIIADATYADVDSAAHKKLYVINSRSKSLHSEGRRLKQTLVRAGLANLISRKALFRHFERIIHHTQSSISPVVLDDGMKTEYKLMTQQTFLSSLYATGSIPALCHPVVMDDNLHYWDGGITDYHIALQYDTPGLVLYPHFSNTIKPGWFDKHLSWRRASAAVTDKMILIHPSKAFIRSLPDQKIPDRKDFEIYFGRDDVRISRWYEVASASEVMAAEFKSLYESGNLINEIEPL